MHQSFKFNFSSAEDIRSFLQSLSHSAMLTEHSATAAEQPNFFVFSQLKGQPSFSFDCELVPEGIHSERAGEYFSFLGLFIEALTAQFGSVSIEDL